MSFIGERILDQKDKKYIEDKGFTYYISEEPIVNARNWAVDWERDIILVSRGGGGPEIPETYGLYLNGSIVDIQGDKTSEGDYYEEGSKIHWHITWIGVPRGWSESGCGTDELKQIITEAFTAFSYINLNPARVLEVTVDISVDPMEKQK